MPQSKPQRPNAAAKAIVQNEDAFATSLVTILIDMYGTESLQWDPTTIVAELQDDLLCEVPRENVDKLMSAVVILNSDAFWAELPDFINICNVLSGDIVDPNMFDPADPFEIAWGVTEASMLSPPEENQEIASLFDPEVIGYIEETLREYGFTSVPRSLKQVTDGGTLSETSGETGDDPTMFNAIHDKAVAKTAEVDEYVTSRLQELVAQIRELKLQDGDPEKAVTTLFGSSRN